MSVIICGMKSDLGYVCGKNGICDKCQENAALRAEVQKMREALGYIVTVTESQPRSSLYGFINRQAKAALSSEPGKKDEPRPFDFQGGDTPSVERLPAPATEKTCKCIDEHGCEKYQGEKPWTCPDDKCPAHFDMTGMERCLYLEARKAKPAAPEAPKKEAK